MPIDESGNHYVDQIAPTGPVVLVDLGSPADITRLRGLSGRKLNDLVGTGQVWRGNFKRGFVWRRS